MCTDNFLTESEFLSLKIGSRFLYRNLYGKYIPVKVTEVDIESKKIKIELLNPGNRFDILDLRNDYNYKFYAQGRFLKLLGSNANLKKKISAINDGDYIDVKIPKYLLMPTDDNDTFHDCWYLGIIKKIDYDSDQIMVSIDKLYSQNGNNMICWYFIDNKNEVEITPGLYSLNYKLNNHKYQIVNLTNVSTNYWVYFCNGAIKLPVSLFNIHCNCSINFINMMKRCKIRDNNFNLKYSDETLKYLQYFIMNQNFYEEENVFDDIIINSLVIIELM